MFEVYVSMRHTPDSMYYAGWIEKGLGSSDIRVHSGFCQIREGDFPYELARKIKSCRNFVAIFTADTFGQLDDNENWMAYEIEIAMKAKANIIPILSKDFVWPEKLPDRIKGIECYEAVVMGGDKKLSSDYENIVPALEKISQRLLFDNKKDVFISYSSKEQHIAEKVKQKLEFNDISCWMAPESIPAGSDYTKEISSAIKNSEVFVLVLSEKSQNSNWVHKELTMATSENLKILPIKIDDKGISEGFEFCLIDCQIVNACDRLEQAIQELVNVTLDFLNK